jgi:Protein of unknown function (DUF2905)
MAGFGKILVLFGAVLVMVGLIFVPLERTNLPIGRLPGDIIHRGKPLTTCILLSIVISCCCV